MKALQVQQVCVACHGAPEELEREVALQLQASCHADKGVGYAIGQIRRDLTVRKTL